MKIMRHIKWVLLLCVLAGIGSCCYSCGPGGNGTIAKLTLADGSEYLVTQHWNAIGEPYAVDFWFKTNARPWGWCYIDHQDTRWWRGSLKHNTTANSVQVFRGNELRGELFLDKKTFALYGGPNRELSAPQEYCNPPRKRK